MNKTVKNAIYLNINLIISTIVTLYSIRVLLEYLGSEDYGLLNLVLGVVVMLAFLNTSMTISTQRNLTYSLEKGSVEFRKTFSNSMFIHAIICAMIIIVGLALKEVVIDLVLNIPKNKYKEVRALYLITLSIVAISIISVPYDSVLSSHERFGLISFLNVAYNIFKLCCALILYFINDGRLIIYAYSLLCASMLFIFIKWIVCRICYEEAKVSYKLICRKNLLAQTSFVGWNTFGALCGVVRIQGLAILLNVFFTLVTNASFAISVQVNSKLKEFSLVITRVLNPKIVKAESRGNREEMLTASTISSQVSLILFGVFSVPLVLNMETVFYFWLGTYPESTLVFVKLFFILSFVNLSTIGLQTSIQAIGDIKSYQITIGTLLLLTLPIGYYCLSIGLPSYSIIIVSIILEGLSCLLRLFFLRYKAGLDVLKYVVSISKVSMAIFMSYLLSSELEMIINFGPVVNLLVSTIFSVSVISILTYLFVLDRNHKKVINKKIFGC